MEYVDVYEHQEWSQETMAGLRTDPIRTRTWFMYDCRLRS